MEASAPRGFGDGRACPGGHDHRDRAACLRWGICAPRRARSGIQRADLAVRDCARRRRAGRGDKWVPGGGLTGIRARRDVAARERHGRRRHYDSGPEPADRAAVATARPDPAVGPDRGAVISRAGRNPCLGGRAARPPPPSSNPPPSPPPHQTLVDASLNRHLGDQQTSGSSRFGSDPGPAVGRADGRQDPPSACQRKAAGSARQAARRSAPAMSARRLRRAALLYARCRWPRAVRTSRARPPMGRRPPRTFPTETGLGSTSMLGRCGVGPATTGISAANAPASGRPRDPHRRHRRLGGRRAAQRPVRGRTRDVAFVTTTYGRTIAIDPGTGDRLWEFVPQGHQLLPGERPDHDRHAVIDPDRNFLYSASPDGWVHKLTVAGGRQVAGPATRDLGCHPREDRPGAQHRGQRRDRGDRRIHRRRPVYQGHVVMIDRRVAPAAPSGTRCARTVTA